ncbi:Kinesin-like protein kip2 [Saitoella coloradoensis]
MRPRVVAAQGLGLSNLAISGESTVKAGENVVVSVRARPGPEGAEWDIDAEERCVRHLGRSAAVGEFFYDNVYNPVSTTHEVYTTSIAPLVSRVMEGYHGTVFAYGQTGSGKTYSMQGNPSSPGIIPLAIDDIFAYIRDTPDREFLLRISYLEIYNERLRDLLADPTTAAIEPKLREDPKRGIYPSPLREEIVTDPTHILRILKQGNAARRTASTEFNDHSSRSHAIITIVIESRDRPSTPGYRSPTRAGPKGRVVAAGGVRVSTLNLIDLAGSERAAADADRRKEGAYINKSLLTLGTVIARLTTPATTPAERAAQAHIPYRDSKLTRLLQPALSGSALISILATINLSSEASSETVSTLKFAQRAKNIVSKAKRNEEEDEDSGDSRALLRRYKSEILDLRQKLEEQALRLQSEGDNKKEERRESGWEREKERHEREMMEMQLARTALKERIEHLTKLILSSKSSGVSSVGRISLGTPAAALTGDPNLSSALAEKDAQIASLEARLRSTSASLERATSTITQKDLEIAELRRQLEDKDQIMMALRMAKKKREMAEFGRVERLIEMGSPVNSPGRGVIGERDG